MREFIIAEEGRRTRVILDIIEYEILLEAAEELQDIRESGEVRSATDRGEEETSLLSEALERVETGRRELRDKNRLRGYRTSPGRERSLPPTGERLPPNLAGPA